MVVTEFMIFWKGPIRIWKGTTIILAILTLLLCIPVSKHHLFK